MLRYRIPGAKYGSMLKPGVGSGTLIPAAPVTDVSAGVALAESVRAAPTCTLTATGSRLPPIRRMSTSPPNDVKLSVAPSGFQVATPAVNFSVPSPRDVRPPHVFPLP